MQGVPRLPYTKQPKMKRESNKADRRREKLGRLKGRGNPEIFENVGAKGVKSVDGKGSLSSGMGPGECRDVAHDGASGTRMAKNGMFPQMARETHRTQHSISEESTKGRFYLASNVLRR